MSSDWRSYQEDSASLFRSMGLDANVDVTIQGVRTRHAIDVLVKSHHAGFDITWLVECKYWKTPVSKLHVLALREIVSDTGADRGILLCEVGFQSGAIEAANLTNVQLTSLQSVRELSGGQISAMRLRELHDRIESCKARYWEIPKSLRIRHGLRQDIAESGFSGANVIDICTELIGRAFRGVYPFCPDTVAALVNLGPNRVFENVDAVIVIITPMIEELELRLKNAELAIKR